MVQSVRMPPEVLPAPPRPVPSPGGLAVPAAGVVEVWLHRTPAGGLAEAQRDRLRADLDPATVARTARYLREADRDRGLLGHALLRRLAAGLVGGTPATVPFELRCVSCGSGDHGKPALVGDGRPELNLSHSGDFVMVALAGPGNPVGADVEGRREVDWATMASTVFDPAEWRRVQAAPDPAEAGLRGWVRKEAAVKATGEGLAVPLREVVVEEAPGGWRTVTPGGQALAGRDVAVEGGYLAAVAIPDRGELPAVLVHRAVLI
jgi:4'-phosphopantetheinyl transferase